MSTLQTYNLKHPDASGNQITFASDGSSAVSGNVNFDSGTVFIDSTNNRLGVGTSSPGANLEVAGSEAEIRLRDTRVDDAGYWGFKSELSNAERKLFIEDDGTNRITIDASGNVGIATTAVADVLHLQTNATGRLLIGPDGTSNFHNKIYNDNGDLMISSEGSASDMIVGSNRDVIFRTGGVAGTDEAARINSSGNLGLGDSTPYSRMMIRGDSGTTSAGDPGTNASTTLSGAIVELVNKSGTTDSGGGIVATGMGTSGRYGAITFVDKTSDNTGTGGEIRFFTSASKTGDLEKNMALTKDGDLQLYGGVYGVPNNGASANSYAHVTDYGTPYYATDITGISHRYTLRRGGTYGFWEHGPYGDNYYFTHGTSSGGATRPNMVNNKELYITSNGSIYNSSGTYSQFSDVRIKENIVDANDQWDDIKALRLVNYNLIGGEERLLGFVAQEVEQTSPGLVDIENPGLAEDADLSEQMKVVKTSIIYMKAVKALQEAMARIETLEAQVSALQP